MVIHIVCPSCVLARILFLVLCPINNLLCLILIESPLQRKLDAARVRHSDNICISFVLQQSYTSMSMASTVYVRLLARQSIPFCRPTSPQNTHLSREPPTRFALKCLGNRVVYLECREGGLHREAQKPYYRMVGHTFHRHLAKRMTGTPIIDVRNLARH